MKPGPISGTTAYRCVLCGDRLATLPPKTLSNFQDNGKPILACDNLQCPRHMVPITEWTRKKPPPQPKLMTTGAFRISAETRDRVRVLRGQGFTYREIGECLGISDRTAFRICREGAE